MLRELRGLTIGVVGGKGKMGSWLCSKLKEANFRVTVSDKKGGADLRSVARRSKIIILSIPFGSLRPVIEEMAPYLTEESLLMDIGSIKEKPLKIMISLTPCSVVGTHPLFGPEAFNVSKLKVALCPGRGEYSVPMAIALWKKLGCETFVLSAEEHDRIMGVIQGVFHFTSIVMAKLIYKMAPKDVSTLWQTPTANFQVVLERLRSIFSQSSWLFGDIFFENRYSALWIKRFLQEGEGFLDMLLQGERQEFSKLFQKLKEVLGDEGDMGQDRQMGQRIGLGSS